MERKSNKEDFDLEKNSSPDELTAECFLALFMIFAFATLCDRLNYFAPLSQPIRSKTKPTCSHAFSLAWRRLHAFVLSSDWFIELTASVVIGQNDYFRFSFTTLD